MMLNRYEKMMCKEGYGNWPFSDERLSASRHLKVGWNEPRLPKLWFLTPLMQMCPSELIHSGSLCRQKEEWEALCSDVWDELYHRNAYFFQDSAEILVRLTWRYLQWSNASYIQGSLHLVADKLRGMGSGFTHSPCCFVVPDDYWTCQGALQNSLQGLLGFTVDIFPDRPVCFL